MRKKKSGYFIISSPSIHKI